MQHIGQKYRRRTDDVQKRVLVGLQLVVLLWLSNGSSVVVKSCEVNASHVNTVVFSFCRSASSSPTRRKVVVVGTRPIRHSSRDRSLAQRLARVKLWLIWYFSSGAA